MKKIIGITGGISSGKSLVCTYIESLGYKLIDCDKISRGITKINNKGYNKVIKYFGNSILNEDLSINRATLAKIVFNDQEKRKVLNSIIHPLVKEEVLEEIKNSSENIIFVDIPLLFETDFKDLCSEVIVVYTTYENQLKRLMSRDNIDSYTADIKIKSQMPLEEKVELADYVIDNNKDIENTKKMVDEILKIIKE